MFLKPTFNESKRSVIFLIGFGIIGLLVHWYIVTHYKAAAADGGIENAIGGLPALLALTY